MKTIIDLENIIDLMEVNKGSNDVLSAFGVDQAEFEKHSGNITMMIFKEVRSSKANKNRLYKKVFKYIVGKDLKENMVTVLVLFTAESINRVVEYSMTASLLDAMWDD